MDRLAALDLDDGTFALGARAQHTLAELEFESLLGEELLRLGCHLVVHAGEDPVQVLDDDHVRTQAPPHGAELEPDVACADHHHPLRHLAIRDGLGAGADAISVQHHTRQARGLAAGGDEDVLRLDLDGILTADARHHHASRCCDPATTRVPRDFVLLEESRHSRGERLHHLLFALEERSQVELHRTHADAVAGKGTVRRLGVDLTRLEEGLAGDAPDVQAGTPERRVLLDHADVQAELGGANRGLVATGTCADHDQIVGVPFHEAWAAFVDERVQRDASGRRMILRLRAASAPDLRRLP